MAEETNKTIELDEAGYWFTQLPIEYLKKVNETNPDVVKYAIQNGEMVDVFKCLSHDKQMAFYKAIRSELPEEQRAEVECVIRESREQDTPATPIAKVKKSAANNEDNKGAEHKDRSQIIKEIQAKFFESLNKKQKREIQKKRKEYERVRDFLQEFKKNKQEPTDEYGRAISKYRKLANEYRGLSNDYKQMTKILMDNNGRNRG